MLFDVSLGNGGPLADKQAILDTAQAAEDLGFRGVWASDHLLPPSNLPQFSPTFEPLTILAFVAARTQRVLLGTSVIVLPMRSPFVVAKQAATLDVLADGRLVLGVGVGSFGDEYVNVHADFHNRGARMDEMLALFQHLWSGSREPFEGRFYGYTDGVFDPLPVRKADLPMLIGGRTDAALRRTARFGRFWQTTTAGPDLFPSLVAKLRAQPGGERVEVGSVLRFEGNLDETSAAIQAWDAAGAQHLSVNFGPLDGRLERMRTFAQAFNVAAPAAAH